MFARGDTTTPSGLYATLYHAFLVLDWVTVLRPSRPKVSHFEDVLFSQSKNCSCICTYQCAQQSCTTQHETLLKIFHFDLETISTAHMLSTGGEGPPKFYFQKPVVVETVIKTLWGHFGAPCINCVAFRPPSCSNKFAGFRGLTWSYISKLN